MDAVAQQHAPNSRIINLGTATIDAYYLSVLPFRMVGLDVQPGETLTPGYYDGRLKFELYWRLQSGDVHGMVVDLVSVLPSTFDGDVVVSIHDDYVEVSWAKIAEEWVQYRNVGNPRKFAHPASQYFERCSGVLLEHLLTTAAWEQRARKLRSTTHIPEEAETKIEGNRCNLEWYLPEPPPGRMRAELDEKTAERLRAEWLAQVEAYKQQQGIGAPGIGRPR